MTLTTRYITVCTEAGYEVHPTDCHVFYICGEDGVRHRFRCPEELVFNIQKGYCEQPHKVPNCLGQDKPQNKTIRHKGIPLFIPLFVQLRVPFLKEKRGGKSSPKVKMWHSVAVHVFENATEINIYIERYLLDIISHHFIQKFTFVNKNIRVQKTLRFHINLENRYSISLKTKRPFSQQIRPGPQLNKFDQVLHWNWGLGCPLVNKFEQVLSHRDPCGQTNRQTRLNTLPLQKLRMLAVTNLLHVLQNSGALKRRDSFETRASASSFMRVWIWSITSCSVQLVLCSTSRDLSVINLNMYLHVTNHRDSPLRNPSQGKCIPCNITTRSEIFIF